MVGEWKQGWMERSIQDSCLVLFFIVGMEWTIPFIWVVWLLKGMEWIEYIFLANFAM